MPIWLRKYTHTTIRDYYEQEKEEYEKEMGRAKTVTGRTPISKLPAPTNNPTYSTKALKK